MKTDLPSIAGVWSATPTPFDDRLRLDKACIPRIIAHHLKLGVRGLFLAGTAGEGPCMTEAQKNELIRGVVKANRGRLLLSLQTTENSAERVLEQIRAAADSGIDIAIVAQPLFFPNATESRIAEFYHRICDASPLPVGLYLRGRIPPVVITPRLLKKILAHPRLVMIKDSSNDPENMVAALAARRRRPELALLTGNEFKTADYMLAGYDGLLLGGGIFNGWLAGKVIEAVQAGDEKRARRLDARICRINYTAFGGRAIKCWLAGQKRLCVELGLFRSWANYYGFKVTPACERAIVRLVQHDGPALRGEAL